MWALLIPLLSQLFGEKGPIGTFLKNKAEYQQAQADYKLAVLKAQSEEAVQNRISDTTDLQTRLNSTTLNFKQNTYVFVCSIIVFSIVLPNHAAQMWANFNLIPNWFSDLFKVMTLAIWGIPVAAPIIGGMFTGISNAIEARREYKIKKFNTKLMFDTIRKGLGGSIDQKNVDLINAALRAGGIDPHTGDDI